MVSVLRSAGSCHMTQQQARAGGWALATGLSGIPIWVICRFQKSVPERLLHVSITSYFSSQGIKACQGQSSNLGNRLSLQGDPTSPP